METLRLDEWTKYKNILTRLSQKAADEFRDAVFNVNGKWGGVGLGQIPRDELIDLAYALVTKYGEGTAAVACEYYDELAALSGALVPEAIPASTATYGETAKAINGCLKQSESGQLLESTIYRLVKQAGADTTLQNAGRDGAQFAWIPTGDTCPFCLTLASRGWQYQSQKAMRNGHAEHIHANCDCQYAVRFNDDTKYEGYDPQKYEDMYYNANTDTQGKITYNRDENGNLRAYRQTASTSRINAMRRQLYQDNAQKIRAQQREAYRIRKETDES